MWRLRLWTPKGLVKNARQVRADLLGGRLPWILPSGEFPLQDYAQLQAGEPSLTCNSFLESRTALQEQGLAAILPDFLPPPETANSYVNVPIPSIQALVFQYRLAWNPRLLRLNPHAGRRCNYLLESLASRMRAISPITGRTRRS
jgi:DNA-binding transcriptional LysR family regulator